VFAETRRLGEFGTNFFHVNFLARDVNEVHWDLFFATIGETYTRSFKRKWGIPLDQKGAESVFFPLRWSTELHTSISRIEGSDLSALVMSAGM
jgi:hypothetical protein